MPKHAGKIFRSALHRGCRRVDSCLAARQLLFWRCGLVLALLLLIAVLIQLYDLGRDIVQFAEYGQRNRIAFADPAALSSDVSPRNRAAPFRKQPTLPQDLPLAADGSPILDWHTDARLHAAAAVLAAQGDLEAAVALLVQTRADELVVREVAETAFGSLRHHLPSVVAAQIQALQEYWQALSPMEQHAFFPAPDRGAVERLGNRLSALPETAKLDDVYEFLPVSLQYWLLGRVHLALIAKSKCPPRVVELVLDLELPQRSLAKQIYWQRKLAPAPPPADQAVAVFTAAVNEVMLWPEFQRFLATQKAEMAQMARPEAVWFRETVGAAPTQALWRTDVEKLTPVRATELWAALPVEIQQHWGDHVYRSWVRAVVAGLGLEHVAPDDLPRLAPMERRANPWLQHVDDPVNRVFLVRAVRTHPHWQLLLREFRHRDALAAVPLILERFDAGKYAKLVLNRLASSVNYEQEEMIKRGFSWSYIARAVNAAADVPPGIAMEWARRQDLEYEPETVPPGRRWLDVAPAKVYDVLRLLAARKSGAERARYELIAKTFAVNRNLKSEETPGLK